MPRGFTPSSLAAVPQCQGPPGCGQGSALEGGKLRVSGPAHHAGLWLLELAGSASPSPRALCCLTYFWEAPAHCSLLGLLELVAGRSLGQGFVRPLLFLACLTK